MAKAAIAVLVIGGLAFFAWTTNQAPDESKVAELPVPKGNQKPPQYEKQGVVGVEPDGAEDFTVDVELAFDGARPELTFTISEAHGWYADYLYVEFWYVETDENGEERQLGNPVRFMCHRYLDFGATLVEHTTPMHLEFPQIPENFGTTENWVARIGDHRKLLAPPD